LSWGRGRVGGGEPELDSKKKKTRMGWGRIGGKAKRADPPTEVKKKPFNAREVRRGVTLNTGWGGIRDVE